MNAVRFHQHLQMITKINTILAVVSLVGVLTLYFWLRFSVTPQKNDDSSVTVDAVNTASPVPLSAPTVSTEELSGLYRSGLTALLKDYEFDDAARAENILSQVWELRVPAEYKLVQLAVVIALNYAKQGDFEQAQQRIDELRQEHAWLTL